MSLFSSFAQLFEKTSGCAPRRPWLPAAAALALLLVGSTEARAQPAPFSDVTLYGGGSAQIGTNRFGDFYQPSPGLDVAATVPFYVGAAGLDVGLRRYEARAGRAGEDFWAVPVALRWGLRPPLGTPRLHFDGGVRLGALFMRFSGGGAGLRNESELLMGADAGLALRLGGGWRLAAGVRYERVFTSTPVQLWHVRAGVRRRFDAPRWLQTLLR